ncbi:acyl-[ACP]--phospholipid O-acyltransferase [Pokkaliibacter plantistimulans]|uniref:Acyl-[ACP]--phospholipid O-acyltransferase n=1 Tax=Proteobacteria bacterium 228 TaxID=2083153 RepID=A0A2S5KWF8_9PROT|nr:acyl-[ACP]--phospholipid O-acyltransferase [Pokkaliibacter plantistimulans]PPC78606.1 acyl-[ACP]--phospholipid O-acyltransferase [Pokkaliibacter plantistimulans]
MKSLMRTLGAVPFLVAVFLNAFTDLGHKIAIQNTVFKVYDGSEQVILTAIINGLILLPYILFFIPVGFHSDKYPKHQVMRLAGWAAVGLTLAITLFYYLGLFWPAFVMTFLMGVQSAWYSPAKFGYIKALFGKEHLAEANGRVQAISIISILAGTLVFSILFEGRYSSELTTPGQIVQVMAPMGWILVACSVMELLLLYRLPALEQPDHSQHLTLQQAFDPRKMVENLQPVLSRKVIRLSIIGLSVFWSVGQVMLAAFPAFAKEKVGIDNTIVLQGILAVTGVGIAIGAGLAARFSRNYIESGLIPVGAAGIAIGLLILPQLGSSLAFAADFLFIGVMGGLFIVPLNALVQFHSGEHELGKVLAGNNLFQNIAMFSFLVLTALFALLGISSQHLLTIIAVIALLGGIYTVLMLPQSMVRFLLSRILAQRYRIEVQGMKNIPEEGGVLLLGNHISWIDWAVVQTACPRPVRFVMQRSIYERWYLNWFFRLFGCVPIESGVSSKSSLEVVARLLDEGEVVCLFPEGAISRNGHLGEFRRGYERACQLAQQDLHIVPFYLRGLWGSQFSRSSAHIKAIRRSGMYRDLIVAFGQPLPRTTTASELKRHVFDISIASWEQHVDSLPTLTEGWIDGVKHLGQQMAIADSQGVELSAYRALAGALCMARRLRKCEGDHIGMLIPASAGGMLANMAALLAGKTLVCLNYTASHEALKSAIEQSGIRTLVTSERFLSRLEQKGMDVTPVLQGLKIVYLESLKEQIGKTEALFSLAAAVVLPGFVLKRFFNRSRRSQDIAAILFSSGSEGAPKGICLSHRNIMTNVKQVSDVLNTQERDVVVASLPLFHAFGLTVTQFMPLVEGIPVVCHADPTDVAGVAKAIARHKATLLCATSTFLRLYCRNTKVHPLMLDSLRIVVAGAERLNPEVRDAFQLKFNKRVLEGYGATETTPVAAVNLPDALDTHYWQVQVGGKAGSVGMPLPGTSIKIVDPETWQALPTGTDGMILIGGPQVMVGYLNNPEKTAAVIREEQGMRWYVTGDKGHLDSDGFLTIVDRYSRFAKLGGEMISLSVVENTLLQAMQQPELELVAVAIKDERKGERVVVLTEQTLELSAVKAAMLAAGANPLMIPAQVFTVAALPRLGTGKMDLAGAKRMAASCVAESDGE